MSERKADIVLHPTRMRILVLLSGQQMTAQQLAKALPDVPQATLYRHINALARHQIIIIVDERQVRGTTEKVYTLDDQAARLNAADLQNATAQDHLGYFTTFVISLLNDFTRYVDQREQPNPGLDGVRYNKGLLYLSDNELNELGDAFRVMLLPFLGNEPNANRRQYIFSTTLLPGVDNDAHSPS
jgi:DNA-binding transcriptional ArsR family regulator